MQPRYLILPLIISGALIASGCGGSTDADLPVQTGPAGAAVDVSTAPLSTTPTKTAISGVAAPTGDDSATTSTPDTPEVRATKTVPARAILAPVISAPEALQSAPRSAGPVTGDLIVTWTRMTREGDSIPARHTFTALRLGRTGNTWQVTSNGAPILTLGRGLDPTGTTSAWRYTATAARALNAARPGGPAFSAGDIAIPLT